MPIDSKQFNKRSLEGLITRHAISYSFSDVRYSIPRVNFKKIKLSSFKNLQNSFKEKNIMRYFLDDTLLKLNFPFKRETEEKSYELKTINPLRKKSDIEQLPYQIEFEEEISEESKVKEEAKKDITFSLEAQVAQEEENVILSPAIVSLPPLKEDVVSSSGEQGSFVWPPQKQKEQKIEKKPKVQKQPSLKKKKPYFLAEEKKRVDEIKAKEEKPKIIKEPQTVQYPWSIPEGDYQSIETIFQGGLESELLDIPSELFKKDIETPVFQEETKKEIKLVFKALTPDFPENDAIKGLLINNINTRRLKHDTDFIESNKIEDGIELLGKGKKMFDKFINARLTPIRIIMLGGFAATLGYLMWDYISPYTKNLIPLVQKQENVVVRDLFKQKHIYKKPLILNKEVSQQIENKKTHLLKTESKKQEKTIEKPEYIQGGTVFKPISENDRLALIQRARESLESRLDPFGQESVLPRSVIDQSAKEKAEEDKPPPDIPKVRKQVELVGVISTNNKDLALVNVYTAEYAVSENDDKVTRETKLKTALSMAVPNREEVSLLDPLENWYVKLISKSKSRSEDPTIELVKGDKKFKLRVGQKVLLPEEKTEPSDEMLAK